MGGWQGMLPVLHYFRQDIKLPEGCGSPSLGASFIYSFILSCVPSYNHQTTNYSSGELPPAHPSVKDQFSFISEDSVSLCFLVDDEAKGRGSMLNQGKSHHCSWLPGDPASPFPCRAKWEGPCLC